MHRLVVWSGCSCTGAVCRICIELAGFGDRFIGDAGYWITTVANACAVPNNRLPLVELSHVEKQAILGICLAAIVA